MRLLRFNVSNFRCLNTNSWIELKNALKLSIFTGQNDGGKTSSLEALQVFLDRKSQVATEDFFKLNGKKCCKEIRIKGVFDLSQSEKEKLNWVNKEIEILNIRTIDGTSKYLYKSMVHSDPKLQRDLGTLSSNELKEILDKYKIQVSDRRSKIPMIEVIKEWLKKQPLQEGYLELPSDFFENFPSILIFKSADALDPEREVNQTLANVFTERIADPKYSGKLKTIQNQIEKDMIASLVDLRESVKKYCIGITNIDIVPTFDFKNGFRTSKLQIEKKNGAKIDINNEGEGQKRRLTLAVYEWRKKILTMVSSDIDKQVIIAFDEPDTHLDYSSQRKILDQIRTIADNPRNYVIICTHSLNLIDRVPLTNIIHFKKNKNKIIIDAMKTEDPALIDMFLYEISDCMGLKNSILLNERCFLIVEGETEFLSLPIIFQKLKGYSLQAGGIRLINAGGCSSVKSLAKFLNDNKRNVSFLVDKDVKTRPTSKGQFTLKQLKKDGFKVKKQVFFVGTVEYEDSFTDELYAKTANTNWPKADSALWTTTEFAAIRGPKFCDDLFALLQSNYRNKITKPDVGEAMAKAITVPEIPAQIVTCLDHCLALTKGY